MLVKIANNIANVLIIVAVPIIIYNTFIKDESEVKEYQLDKQEVVILMCKRAASGFEVGASHVKEESLIILERHARKLGWGVEAQQLFVDIHNIDTEANVLNCVAELMADLEE